MAQACVSASPLSHAALRSCASYALRTTPVQAGIRMRGSVRRALFLQRGALHRRTVSAHRGIRGQQGGRVRRARPDSGRQETVVHRALRVHPTPAALLPAQPLARACVMLDTQGQRGGRALLAAWGNTSRLQAQLRAATAQPTQRLVRAPAERCLTVCVILTFSSQACARAATRAFACSVRWASTRMLSQCKSVARAPARQLRLRPERAQPQSACVWRGDTACQTAARASRVPPTPTKRASATLLALHAHAMLPRLLRPTNPQRACVIQDSLAPTAVRARRACPESTKVLLAVVRVASACQTLSPLPPLSQRQHVYATQGGLVLWEVRAKCVAATSTLSAARVSPAQRTASLRSHHRVSLLASACSVTMAQRAAHARPAALAPTEAWLTRSA